MLQATQQLVVPGLGQAGLGHFLGARRQSAIARQKGGWDLGIQTQRGEREGAALLRSRQLTRAAGQ